jgi:hypothetical protein
MTSGQEEEYSISHKLLKLASGQFDLQSIRILTLCNLNIPRIVNLQECIKVETLDLSANQIQVIEGLESLTKLRVLNLSDNKITKIEGLDKQKNLQTLNLGNNLIKEDVQKLANLQKLRNVNLSGNPIAEDPQLVTTIKTLLPKISYINGEHVLLQMQLTFDEQTESFVLPESKSWTITPKGKSIFEPDDDEQSNHITAQSSKDSATEVKGAIVECKKLIARADSLAETMRQYLK